ncbi:MAG: hypothetical protein KBS97_01225 [Firmicutes bacterium]|nr:hypothetical protein [Candidatus Fiminaster equi]
MRNKYFFVFMAVCLSSCSLTKTDEKIDVSDIVIPNTDHEYFEVDYISINWSDILLQNKDTYYVYIYSLTCTHCQELKNYIIDEALKRDDIFFVKGSNKDVIKTDVSNTIGATEVKDIAILGYPSMLKISNKTLVQNVAGNSKIIDILK